MFAAYKTRSTKHETRVKEVLRHAVLELQRAHVESASLDARILLEHVLGLSREQLLYSMDDMLAGAQHAKYMAIIDRRAARCPVAKLTAKREFWGREFTVSEATLDPRPDSETLIQVVLDNIPDRKAALSILDLGTGTGCLLLTLLQELPHARGVGVDASEAALAVAKENMLRFGLQSRTMLAHARWCDDIEGTFDIVISNPPYIPALAIDRLAPEVARWEPRLALDGGPDGLNAYRELMPALPEVLAPKGIAALEIGMGQQKAVEEMATRNGLWVVDVRNDMGGIPRCILLQH